ncbi:MAG: hypothetical protein ACOCTI_03475 [Phycisphaeraceae bacterium]
MGSGLAYLKSVAAEAARSLWANIIPAGILWLVGLAILVGYYHVPPVQAALQRVADVRDHWGVWFALVSTAVFGGLLPGTIEALLGRARKGWVLADLGFLLLLWAQKGLEVDLFYRFQAWLLGEGTSLATVLPKVAVDMGIYAPFWAVPTMVLALRWKDGYYRRPRWRDRPGWAWYREHLLPITIINASFWTPAVLVIYSLPLALQLPVQNLLLCLWSLMVLFMVARPAEEHPAPTAAAA